MPDTMKVPRPLGSRFETVPRAEIPRSQFDLSFGLKTTFDAGWLVPIMVEEALPGDTWNVSLQAFARLATPLKPVMDNMYLETFFFAVPYRLIWDNWKKFNGEQSNPGDSTDYIIPAIGATVGPVTVMSLADYMGLPIGLNPNSIFVSALPFRAYSLVYNQWFRDENLQSERSVPLTDGPDNVSSRFLTMEKRGKRHDYFTSALPWPQKGTAVSLPLGTSAPVVATNAAYGSSYVTVKGQDGNHHILQEDGGVNRHIWMALANDGASSARALYADLAAATAASINQIRQAFQVQRLYERDARGGTRYTEILKSHFGVVSPDQRLQRSEYLGGGSSYINISPVAQTSSTDATTPQGNLTGIGTTVIGGHGFTKSFTEHCIILGLASARADLSYQQGVHRMWSRRTRFDHYWPALANIGEQAVLNKEIFYSGVPATDDAVFGYQERHAEYRYKPSMITGLFRSDAPGSLDLWHLAQDFAALPALNAAFIIENPPIDRVIAVPAEPHFLFDGYFKIKAARPMPIYGVPGLMDHF